MTREELAPQLIAVREMMKQQDFKFQDGYRLAGEVRSVPVDGVPHKFRWYPAGDGAAPLYIDIHGGGMCWGSMEDTDPFARALNEQLQIHVLSPDYPLAPEHQFPTQPEYVYDTIREVLKHAREFGIDTSRVIVGGCSAGANLATVQAMLAAQRREFSFVGQVLDHPWLDLCGLIPWEDRPTAEGSFTRESMAALALGYADPAQQKAALCTPLNADRETLERLPPAIVQTCERDPLRPEGDRYAEMLKAVGVRIKWHCYPGAEHGFSQGPTEIGAGGRQWLIDAIREMGWLEV